MSVGSPSHGARTYQLRERLHDELLQDLLLARGVFPELQDVFLNPDFERDSHDPFLLPDMEVAVDRLVLARKNNELVCVWSDYDCDGIPGGVMLAEFLRSVGFRIRHYIPHRHKEGYGLNLEGLKQIKEEGVSLVVTVDLGITDVEPVAYANSLGLEVIISDHHLVHMQTDKKGKVKQILPPALAVVNPKRIDSKYPFDGLCGAGVAWKIAQAVLARDRFGLAEGQEKWLLDLVGLATVADRMPLLGENRMLAHYGLLVMRRARRPGLAALLSQMRTKPGNLTEDDIGFMIAPRINAASRMDEPELAARLLGTVDREEAKSLAKELEGLNTQRKVLVATTVKEVNKRMHESGNEASVIVMGSPSWRPGILGLVATSLVESHGKPVFLWGREGGQMLRGSCRSDGSVNVVELMQGAREVFDDFGGHFASGGFSLLQERAHELQMSLVRSYETLNASTSAIAPTVLERELVLPEVAHAHRVLKQLAPFGEANKKPLFLFPKTNVSRVRTFGKANDHLELTLMHEDTYVGGIAFFSTQESFTKPVESGSRVDVVGHVETDWRGSPRIRIIDII